MATKICLVLHRKSANEPAVKEAVKQVRKAGHDLRVRIPWNKKEKPRVVKEALGDGATRIIAGGGDGTINAVVNALVRKGKKRAKTTLGILPLGTANDFARGLGLPVTDLPRCLEIACSWPARYIDVGKANSRFFINVTSGGFGAEITATTPVDMKKKLGGGAYTIMGLIKARGLQPYRGKLLIPGEEPTEGGMLIMAVGNNRLAGGGFEVAPKAALDDGLLDLAIVQHRPKMEFAKAVAELKDPTNTENQYIYYRQLSEFTIDAEQKVHFNLDGEPTRKRKLTFSVLPKHLGVAF
jgi:lipid kinase YegS